MSRGTCISAPKGTSRSQPGRKAEEGITGRGRPAQRRTGTRGRPMGWALRDWRGGPGAPCAQCSEGWPVWMFRQNTGLSISQWSWFSSKRGPPWGSPLSVDDVVAPPVLTVWAMSPSPSRASSGSVDRCTQVSERSRPQPRGARTSVGCPSTGKCPVLGAAQLLC